LVEAAGVLAMRLLRMARPPLRSGPSPHCGDVLRAAVAALVEPGTRALVRAVSINEKATVRVAFSLIGGGGGNHIAL